MRKYLAFILAVILMLGMATAYALNEPVSIKLTPVDPVTGSPTTQSYTKNTLFCLRVDVGVPRFTDISHLDIGIEVCSVEVSTHNVILADGTYYIEGVVLDFPASVTVRVKDNALKEAETAEEYYIASQIDRSTRATYNFNSTQPTKPAAAILPKTGDKPILRWLYE